MAIQVEALITVGRQGEARALAERFLAGNRSGVLARRVAALVGIDKP
jgi:short-subunit dehydrogenase involved in D-alanine esterification of teichoic acids